MIDRLAMWLSKRERNLMGIGLARVLIGAGGLHFYVSSYTYHALLFGPSGYRPTPVRPSFYALTMSSWAFEALFHAGLLAALAFAIFGGRILAAAHAVSFWSLYAIAPGLFDGGDRFGRITALLMVGVVNDAYFSPRASRRRERLAACPSTWRTFLHNGTFALLVFQVVVVYLMAGFWKVSDIAWRSGTALYQIAQLEDHRLVAWTGIVSNPIVVTLLTYSVVVLEISFVATVRSRLRVPAAMALAVMHAGIAVTMGLVGFALHMWGGLSLCLSEAELRGIARRLTRTEARLSGKGRLREP